MPKAKKKSGRMSSTKGRDKGENCHKSVAKNYYCSSRGYKGDRALYMQGCIEVSNMKGNLPVSEVIKAKQQGEL